MKKKNKAIFLDRDGVINRTIIKNHKPYPPKTINKFKVYNDVKLLNNLKKKYYLIIITNQPDVKNKIIKKELVKKFHKKILNKLLVDKIYVCYHNDQDKCSCRKPGIKFFLDAKKKFNLSLKKSYFIGDRWRDMLAGNKAKCINIFLDRNYFENFKYKFKYHYKCKNLKQAINYIKRKEKII